MIIIKLQEERGSKWNVSTIRTLLTRLVDRGFLAVAVREKEHYYAVIVDEQTYLKQATKGFLSAFILSYSIPHVKWTV